MESSERGRWRGVLAASCIAVVIVFFFVWLFAAALHNPQPHGLMVGFVGPAAAQEKVLAGAEARSPGVFFFAAYASEDEARGAILERDIAGALVVGPGKALVLVASAGGQPAATMIASAFTAMIAASGQPGLTATVEDVQPLPTSDSRGLVEFFLVLGVSVAAFVFALVLRQQSTRLPLLVNIGVLLVFAAVAGLVASLAVSIVVGFNVTYWSVAGVCSLLALAVAAGSDACMALFGRPGVGVAGLVLLLLGNASSGSVVGSAFLSQPFRWLSPGLPGGPALDSVRSVLYFDGAGAAWWLGTLAIWAVASLVVSGCAEGFVRLCQARRAKAVV
jgi:hypothetical protein